MKKLLFLFSVFLILGLSLPAAALQFPPLFQVTVGSTTYDVIDQASEGTYIYNNSGDYIGTVLDANDSLDLVDAVLETYFGDIDIILTSYAKVEEGDTSSSSDLGSLYVDYADAYKSGTWATYTPGWDTSTVPAVWMPGMSPYPDPSETVLNFYVVKGAKEFALYWINPAMSAGTWNVENLLTKSGNIPTISHFSGYVATSVPEPSTMLLLGCGLIGLAAFGRRKFRTS